MRPSTEGRESTESGGIGLVGVGGGGSGCGSGIGLGTLFRFWAYRTVVFAGELDEPSAPGGGEPSGLADVESSALGEEEREHGRTGR